MRASLVWIAVGMGGAFLMAAVISASLGGPGWPYYLGLGVLGVGAAVVLGLGRP